MQTVNNTSCTCKNNTNCACANTAESCEKYACAEIGLYFLCENDFQTLNHGTKDHLDLLVLDSKILHPAVKLSDQLWKIDSLLPLTYGESI